MLLIEMNKVTNSYNYSQQPNILHKLEFEEKKQHISPPSKERAHRSTHLTTKWVLYLKMSNNVVTNYSIETINAASWSCAPSCTFLLVDIIINLIVRVKYRNAHLTIRKRSLIIGPNLLYTSALYSLVSMRKHPYYIRWNLVESKI